MRRNWLMMRADARLPERGAVVRGRPAVLTLILLAGIGSIWFLSQQPGELRLTRGGMAAAWSFLSRALTPALNYESDVPPGTVPLIWKAVSAAKATVTFAAAALSLAVVGGIVLAFLASSAWWTGETVRAASPRAWAARAAGPIVYGVTRVLIAILRSIHELLWAVLLLAAFGLGHLTAVLAIAIPYSAILAKVFSEMIDEVPREPARALRDAGASPVQSFLFGLLPRAFPDMAAYAFYRFECGLRSSAILGFFGFPTLGYYISASFDNLLYGEVWTYLYVMFALVAAVDWWSGALRRRFVV
jgi:phosphonate transport system permease protein